MYKSVLPWVSCYEVSLRSEVRCLSVLSMRVKFPDIHKAHFHAFSHPLTKFEPQWRRLYH